jgi:thymidylate kinase
VSRFIYIAGADGTGKSTQARMVMDGLAARGVPARHVWMRFPFFLSLPLLAFARWRGYSWHEEQHGVRYGYWDFRGSWLLRNMLPWLLLVDALIGAMREIYPQLWRGRTVVCERFVLDMLVDLAVAIGDERLHLRLPGRLYTALIPRDAAVAILDLEIETVHGRRPELRSDRQLGNRLRAFRTLASDLALRMLSSAGTVGDVNDRIAQMSGQMR